MLQNWYNTWHQHVRCQCGFQVREVGFPQGALFFIHTNLPMMPTRMICISCYNLLLNYCEINNVFLVQIWRWIWTTYNPYSNPESLHLISLQTYSVAVISTCVASYVYNVSIMRFDYHITNVSMKLSPRLGTTTVLEYISVT